MRTIASFGRHAVSASQCAIATGTNFEFELRIWIHQQLQVRACRSGPIFKALRNVNVRICMRQMPSLRLPLIRDPPTPTAAAKPHHGHGRC